MMIWPVPLVADWAWDHAVQALEFFDHVVAWCAPR
jgi:hypothetical protein